MAYATIVSSAPLTGPAKWLLQSAIFILNYCPSRMQAVDIGASVVRRCNFDDNYDPCFDWPVANLHSRGELRKRSDVSPPHTVPGFCANLKSDRTCNMVS